MDVYGLVCELKRRGLSLAAGDEGVTCNPALPADLAPWVEYHKDTLAGCLRNLGGWEMTWRVLLLTWLKLKHGRAGFERLESVASQPGCCRGCDEPVAGDERYCPLCKQALAIHRDLSVQVAGANNPYA